MCARARAAILCAHSAASAPLFVRCSPALPDVSGLSAISAAAAASVNKRLMTLLFERFHLLEHLNALKRFLLLAEVRSCHCVFASFVGAVGGSGVIVSAEVEAAKTESVPIADAIVWLFCVAQGDFVSHLMESIAPELDKPATELMTHNLIGFLESSIRGTNLQFESKDILDRVDIQIVDHRNRNPGTPLS